MDHVIDLRQSYLVAAQSAVDLADTEGVSARWESPSALPEWSVAGLTTHLLGQIHGVAATLAEPANGCDLVTLHAHYAQIPWRLSPLNDEVNVTIRQDSEDAARTGPEDQIARARAVLAEVAESLDELPLSRPVKPPWTEWALVLRDFLITRLMEIAVHSDDLAVSIGIPPPTLPEEVMAPVRHLLIDLAANRHGDAPVLRALARRERAPNDITAF